MDRTFLKMRANPSIAVCCMLFLLLLLLLLHAIPIILIILISDNTISIFIPAVSNMTNLETLLLSYNQINSIPDSICRLKHLQTLWLSNNHITSLPADFGMLAKLDWTRWCTSSALDGNPLRHPPLHVAKQGPKAIANYFKNKQAKVTNQQ